MNTAPLKINFLDKETKKQQPYVDIIIAKGMKITITVEEVQPMQCMKKNNSSLISFIFIFYFVSLDFLLIASYFF
jgi:hypothetical protein